MSLILFRTGRPHAAVRPHQSTRSGMADGDLAAIIPHKPDGIVLPKAEGSRSLTDLISA